MDHYLFHRFTYFQHGFPARPVGSESPSRPHGISSDMHPHHLHASLEPSIHRRRYTMDNHIHYQCASSSYTAVRMHNQHGLSWNTTNTMHQHHPSSSCIRVFTLYHHLCARMFLFFITWALPILSSVATLAQDQPRTSACLGLAP